MSESSQWQRVCVVCVRHPHDEDEDCGPSCRHVQLDTGHLCPGCAKRLVRLLEQIPELAAGALGRAEPEARGSGGGGSTSAKAPVDLDAIDPPGLPVLLEPSDPSTEMTILEALEGWERVVREDRGLARLGPASLLRDAAAGDTERPSPVTLLGCCSFLARQVAWMGTEPEFDVRGFAELLARIAAELYRWSPEAEDRSGWRVSCPTLREDGTECGHRMVVRDVHREADRVWCRGCGRLWEPRRLVAVAGRDADVWGDGEAIVAWTGIPLRTVRRWARARQVRRWHGLFSLADVQAAATRLGRADGA